MDFEYDRRKSETNKAKHGIDFEEAKALWEDTDRIQLRAILNGEERFPIIGQIAGKHWTTIVTYRGNRVRIISVRRSREREVQLYEKNKHGGV